SSSSKSEASSASPLPGSCSKPARGPKSSAPSASSPSASLHKPRPATSARSPASTRRTGARARRAGASRPCARRSCRRRPPPEPGETSPPIRLGSRLIVLKVLEREESQLPDFDEARRELGERVYLEKMAQAKKTWLDGLRRQHYVEIRL